MTPEELKNLIAGSPNLNWYNNINETISFKYIDIKPQFTSVSALFEFVTEQSDAWQTAQEVPAEIGQQSKNRFQTLRNQIEHFVKNSITLNDAQLKSQWQNTVKPHLIELSNAFTFNSPEVKFLIDISKKSSTHFQGAYQYIMGNTPSVVSSKPAFEGALLAYEFLNKNGSSLSERITKENDSLSKLKDEFQIYLNKTESHLTKTLNEGSEKVKSFVDSTIEYKNKKEVEVNNWLKNSQDVFNSFSTNSTLRIRDLEKTYEELLRLKKPAEYWQLRATQLKKEGRITMGFLIGLILIGSFCLYFLLWKTPEGMLASFFDNDKSRALRWSIVFITFISLIFLGIRYLSKVMFSSFHLSRDAEERQQLTYVYLALIKDAAIDPKERELIMQSLFSRADSGLLKEDSAPTMPNGIDKFIK